MSRTQLWILTVLLVGGAFYVFFVMLPGRQSELARKGKLGYGTVEYKDSRPTPDGTVYTVMLLYQDEQNKNHRHEVVMNDVGAWNDLKAKQDIKVYYLPDKPDEGSIPGGAGMTTPRAGAFKFLAWTALIAGVVCGVYAWRAPKPSRKPRGPTITRT